jgi:hypothetical protein
MTVVGVLVALVASGCELIWDLAGSTPGPLLPLGEVVDAGRVEMPDAGFAITIPNGWTVEVASPMPDLVDAPSGAAWEALRAYTPERSETCSVYVAVPPEGSLSDDVGAGIGASDAFRQPRLDLSSGAPTLLVPAPRIESASAERADSVTTSYRIAASDPGTPRDVVYGLVCGADRERDFEPIFDTFASLPIPPGIVPGAVVSVSLGIYSGRPDPSWPLTETQTAELGRLSGSLPSAVGEPPEGGLGYHGFTVVVTTAGGQARTLVAFRGTLAAPGVGRRVYLVDAGRTVERYLLDTGRPFLSATEVDAVDADLATDTGG